MNFTMLVNQPDHSVGSGHLFSLHFMLSVSGPGQRVARARLLAPGISHRRRRTFSPPPQVRLHSPHGPHSVQAASRIGLCSSQIVHLNVYVPNKKQ